MSTLAVLAREVGVHERTLRRAVNEGTLRATRTTPRTLEVPLSERRYIRRSWPLLGRLREVLRTEPNVRLAMLFGSLATGDDGPDSDVDILVSLRDPSLERLVDLSSKLATAAGRPVDLVRLEEAESDPRLFAQILDTGRALVDREELLPSLRQGAAELRLRGREDDARRKRSALAGIDRLLSS